MICHNDIHIWSHCISWVGCLGPLGPNFIHSCLVVHVLMNRMWVLQAVASILQSVHDNISPFHPCMSGHAFDDQFLPPLVGDMDWGRHGIFARLRLPSYFLLLAQSLTIVTTVPPPSLQIYRHQQLLGLSGAGTRRGCTLCLRTIGCHYSLP